MAKLIKEWLEDNAVDGSKIKLTNDQWLKARNFANSGDINIAKVNASDEIELASVPVVGASYLIPSSEKGANSGVATLDSGGKIPAAQLPNTVMEYKGVWNANTNSPSLSDASGNAGDVYLVTTAGTQDLGSGSQTFAVGDWVVYSGSIWQKSINSNAVVSVNGQQGVVSLDTDDIAEGSALYFTEARVLGTDLAGFSAGAGTVTSADTVLSAFNKIVGNINAFTGADAEYVVFTLSAGDITNQYVDLSHVAMTDSISVCPKGGIPQEPGVDYTISYTGGSGGNSRISFAGDLASTLVAGHKLMVKYLRA